MAATMRLIENPRQGFDGLKATVCPGSSGAKSNTALGDTASLTTESCPSTTVYVYNALGQLAAEYDNSSSSATGTSYLFTDMLGSVRTITNASGNVIECYDYLPFGRILSASDNGRNAAGLNNCFPATPDTNLTSAVDEKFTGQKRDNETGLDYFGARYMSAPLGRFMSPDPLYIEAGRLADPQQLNLYSYVRNNPMRFTDTTGMYIDFDCDSDEICDEALNMFNDRSGAQFQVGFGKNNRLEVIGDIAKKLSKGEKALLNAINDESKGGLLRVYEDTGSGDFGFFISPGLNAIDTGNLSKLNASSNSGGIKPGDVVAHEGLESYFSSRQKKNVFTNAHNKVLSSGLPGLGHIGGDYIYDSSMTSVIGVLTTFRISDRNGSMFSATGLATPIPIESLSGRSQPEINSIIKSSRSRVVGVAFE